MGEEQAATRGCARAAKRARGVTLHHHQRRRGAAQDAIESGRDILDMFERIAPTGAAKRSHWQVPQPMIGKVEAGVLTG
jgi:hypothetical protein